MAPLVVDPAALDGAGASLVDVGKDIGLTLSTLTGTLSGCGSMCGNDPVGEAMGNAYDRSADTLLKGIATARNSLVNLGDGVRMSAFNYSVAEAQSDVSGRAQPLPVPAASAKISASSAPSAVGAGDAVPAGWGWVAKYIGMIWPNGDSAKLRSAAGAWVAAGTQLLVTEATAAGPLGIVGSQQIPEGETIGQMFSASLSAASQIMSATTNVASKLTTYAGQIDTTHAAIVDLLSRICDPLTGIKEIWDILTDEDEDEIKQIADDIKAVVDSFSSEASALASEISTEVSALETVVSGLASAADKEWDQFLHGTEVGRAINQVGQVFKGLGLEAGGMVKDIAENAWKYNVPRMVIDTDGYLDDVKDQFNQMAPLVGLGGDHAPAVLDVWKQVGKDVTHWDMWGTNPAEALGRTITDVGSFFIPGGVSGKVTSATHALENAAEHLPGAVEHLPRALPDAVPPVRPPTPEVPAPPRPVESAPGPSAPRPGEPTPTPAPRPAEPSSLPPEAPRPTSPTESRPAAPAPNEAPSTPAAAGESAPASPGGRGTPESAPAPASSPSPAGHDVPATAPSAGAVGAPTMPDLSGIASAAGSAGEGLPKLPDLGGIASSAAGAGDELVPAGVSAHGAEAASDAASHGPGPSGGDGSGSGSGGGDLGSGGDGPGAGGDHRGAGGDHTPPGGHDEPGTNPHEDAGDGHDGSGSHNSGDDADPKHDSSPADSNDPPAQAPPVAVEGHDYGFSPEHIFEQLENPADEIARLHDAGVPSSIIDGYDPLAGRTIEEFQRDFTFRDNEGRLRWDWAGQAPNDGFAGVPSVSDHIPAGHELDRFGSNGGSFMSDEGAPLSARGMPPGIASDYNNFVGTGRPVPDGLPWEVRYGPLKEAFGQPGGANQWVVIDTRTGEQIPVDTLIKKRMISER